MNNLGNKIKDERKKQRLTQEQLAEKVGITSFFLSQIETGKRSPSLETLYNISVSLGVTIDSLFHQEDNRSRDVLSQLEQLLNGKTEKEQILAYDVIQLLFNRLDEDKRQ